MQLPITSGIYTDADYDFRVKYPVNLMPIALNTGINRGYLRHAYGIQAHTPSLPGIGRGGINWDGILFRVCGTKLVSVDANGVVTTQH